MSNKRIIWALLITATLFTFTTIAQAQSTRMPWPRGSAGNNPVPVVPEQVALETALQEATATAQGPQGGILDTLEPMKTAIVGSWLGTSSEGNKLISTYNSDGTTHGSVQTEVSTNPELGVLTPTHGVWKHLGGRQFGITVFGVLYDINTGAYMGMLKVRALLTLNEAGDQMTGTDKVEIFDPHGNLVFTASGSTPYKRIKFEPFN